MNRKLVLLKRNALLSSNARVFCHFPLTSPLMRSTTISSATLLSSTTWFLPLLIAFCFAANFLHSAILEPSAKNPARYVDSGSARPCKNWCHFAIESERKFWYGQALPLIFFSFFFKTHFISVYQHFAFYFFALCFNSFNSEACLLRNSISLQVGFHFAFYLHFISHS